MQLLGGINVAAEYYIEVSIGTPLAGTNQQSFMLQVDTGK